MSDNRHNLKPAELEALEREPYFSSELCVKKLKTTSRYIYNQKTTNL